MEEFCTEFHRVETQISDRELTFRGRLLIFMRTMPYEARTCINLSRLATMDHAYQTACIRAEAFTQGQQPQRIERLGIRDRDHQRPAAISAPAPLAITAPPATTEAPGENLDMLNKMDAANSKCYGCGKYGHFTSRCPNKPDAMTQGTPARRGGWKGASATPRRSFNKPTYGKPKQTFHAMEQSTEPYSDEDDSPQAQHHEPAFQVYQSPDGYVEDLEEEYESDYEPPISFNSMAMAMNLDDGASNDASGEWDSDSDTAVEEELYELSSDEREAKTPMLSILPTYEAEIGGTTCKMLIDTGATTVYVRARLVKELRLKTTKVKARRVKVADDDIKVVNKITTVDIKLGNLPVETLTAYVFPLKDLDLVLGTPWLEKHNLHVDFHTKTYEFTRNGRRYTLYPPSSKPSKLRVVDPEEFRAFINEDPKSTEIGYLLSLIDVGENNVDDIPLQDLGRQISCQERRQLEREKEKMNKWIKMHRERLL